jgi:hypothetical protein
MCVITYMCIPTASRVLHDSDSIINIIIITADGVLHEWSLHELE